MSIKEGQIKQIEQLQRDLDNERTRRYELEAENAALREESRDAERYRWLRSYNAFAVTEKDGEGGYTLMGDEYLDAAIDDEMGKGVK